jgi:MFS family permease
VTVYGLCAVVVGLAGTACALGIHTGPAAGPLAAGPLLLAGLGGGAVVSPNLTLTLSDVPVRMAGAAGGALQTGGRIGAAIGTALLAGVYYTTLDVTGDGQGVAVVAALLCAILFMLAALVIAVFEERRSTARARLAAGARIPDAA